jgi:hypothetical protein
VRGRTRGTELVAGLLVIAAAGLGLGAAPVPTSARASAPAELCIPILMSCGSTTPTPTPSAPSTDPAYPVPGGGILPLPGLPADGGSPIAVPPAPPTAIDDPDAPVMTLPAAQLAGSSIEFSGLSSVTLVTVPLADGQRAPALRLEADFVAMNDFSLDVRKPGKHDAAVTDAGRMELHGHVKVYIDSLTASTVDGLGFTLGAQNTPPGTEVPSRLLRVDLGLVGVTGDSISFTPVHQYLKDI